MKLLDQFTVEVEGGKFTFEWPDDGQVRELVSDIPNQIGGVFSFLRKVENVQGRDGKDLDADGFRSVSIPMLQAHKIVTAFFKHIGGADEGNAKAETP